MIDRALQESISQKLAQTISVEASDTDTPEVIQVIKPPKPAFSASTSGVTSEISEEFALAAPAESDG